LPDFAGLQKRRNMNKQELAAQQSRAVKGTERATALLKELNVAHDALTHARHRVDAACRFRDERAEDWYRERRMHDQLNVLGDLLRACRRSPESAENGPARASEGSWPVPRRRLTIL
jgi:hypothetical protein